jgi:hypothetical protein
MALTNSSLFNGSTSFSTLSFIVFYKFSMGFKSWEFVGHESILLPCDGLNTLDSLLLCISTPSSMSISVSRWSQKSRSLSIGVYRLHQQSPYFFVY